MILSRPTPVEVWKEKKRVMPFFFSVIAQRNKSTWSFVMSCDVLTSRRHFLGWNDLGHDKLMWKVTSGFAPSISNEWRMSFNRSEGDDVSKRIIQRATDSLFQEDCFSWTRSIEVFISIEINLSISRLWTRKNILPNPRRWCVELVRLVRKKEEKNVEVYH